MSGAKFGAYHCLVLHFSIRRSTSLSIICNKNGHIHIRLVSVYDAIFYSARIRYTVVDRVTVLGSGPSQNFGREGPQWLECS